MSTEVCPSRLELCGIPDGSPSTLLCARRGEHTKHLELEQKPHPDVTDEHWVWVWQDSTLEPSIELPVPDVDLVGGISNVPGELWAKYVLGDQAVIDQIHAAAEVAGAGSEYLDFRDWTEAER